MGTPQYMSPEQARDEATNVVKFLVNLFSVSDPGEARGNTITAREVLDKGAKEIARTGPP